VTTVLVPLATGFEDLEAVTITDLLRRAQIDVVTAGLSSGPIRGARGTTVVPDLSLEQALEREFDMVVLPGGQPGATNLEQDSRIAKLLHKMVNQDRYTAAICAAPKVIAAAGLLDNRRATSFPGSLDPKQYPKVHVENLDVVADGKIITSRGPGTAMDFALTLIELLAGRDKRNQVEAGLQRPASHRTGAHISCGH